MKYLLDTNICIYLMKNSPASVAEHFAACTYGDVGVSAVTVGELEYGLQRMPEADRPRAETLLESLLEDLPVITFDRAAAKAYGLVRHAASTSRTDALDKLIAATAIANQLVVVTNNEADFRRYPNLQVENWVS